VNPEKKFELVPSSNSMENSQQPKDLQTIRSGS
jgi:hypothetical protein